MRNRGHEGELKKQLNEGKNERRRSQNKKKNERSAPRSIVTQGFFSKRGKGLPGPLVGTERARRVKGEICPKGETTKKRIVTGRRFVEGEAREGGGSGMEKDEEKHFFRNWSLIEIIQISGGNRKTKGTLPDRRQARVGGKSTYPGGKKKGGKIHQLCNVGGGNRWRTRRAVTGCGRVTAS